LNQQFVEDLVTLKNLYQSLREKMEQDKAHAKEQLTHVNALLVDEIVESQRFVENLIELRNHYQGVLQECVSKADHAKELLSHVNALLADQLVLQHNQQPVSIQASSVSESPALTEATDISTQESPTQEDELDQGAGAVEVDESSGTSEVEEVDKQQEVDEPNDALSHSESASPSTTSEVVQSHPDTDLDFSVNGQAPKNQSPPLKTPMLPQYKKLTKFEAVERVMREKAGKILHIGWITRALHGDLVDDDLKTERGRMIQTLNDGAKIGLWDKVPGESGCYTIDLKLVEPDLTAKSSQTASKSELQPSMLPAYANIKSIDAVDLVINEKAGQILTTDLVVETLYGLLSGRKLKKAKEIVGSALWRGAQAKRWQRVPGKQRGAYTLDLRLLKSEPRRR